MRELPPQRNIKLGFTQKILLANFSIRITLSDEGGIRPISKGAPHGLESTEDRRSIGRHGNQHVYVRDPQVGGIVTS